MLASIAAFAGKTAAPWLLRNWKLVAVGVVLVGALSVATCEHIGRLDAEKALADQKTQILEDANEAWAEREKKRQAFEKEVREGLAKLTTAMTAARANNDTFKRQVNSNVANQTPLSAADLLDLQLLESGSGKAGGDSVRPAGAPSDLR